MDSAFIVPGQRIVQDINPSTRVLNHEGIASYTRYSSDKQDASSVEQQDVSIATAANTRGQQVDRHLAFSDEAVSGTKLRRDTIA